MFYISSRGSTATGWIANILSSHPKIVCFSASRSIPPLFPGDTYPKHEWIKEISPERYIQSLVLSEKSSFNQKIFGSIHGYHGILAKKECEKFGGFFGYVTRHPLERIHSCFIYDLFNLYYKKETKIKNSEISLRVYNILKNENEFKSNSSSSFTFSKFLEGNKFKIGLYNFIKKEHPDLLEKYKNFQMLLKQKYINQISIKNEKEEKVFVMNHFKKLCEDFFSKDRILFDNCRNGEQGMKMEELLSSVDYFKNKLLINIISEDLISKEYLDTFSKLKEKRMGIHRELPIKTEQIWTNMPKVLKKTFLNSYNKYNIEEISQFFDYKMNI